MGLCRVVDKIIVRFQSVTTLLIIENCTNEEVSASSRTYRITNNVSLRFLEMMMQIHDCTMTVNERVITINIFYSVLVNRVVRHYNTILLHRDDNYVHILLYFSVFLSLDKSFVDKTC